jgi:hypothetical protein
LLPKAEAAAAADPGWKHPSASCRPHAGDRPLEKPFNDAICQARNPEPREILIGFRASRQERERLKRLAGKRGESASQLLREPLLRM